MGQLPKNIWKKKKKNSKVLLNGWERFTEAKSPKPFFLDNSNLFQCMSKQPNMERIARGQAFGSKSPTKASKILEVNFRHPLIKSLKDKVSADAEDESAKDLAQLMFDSAL